MNKSRPILAVMAATLLNAGIASGQSSTPWLEGRRATSGIGIRTGDLELHPGVAGEVGYDSNYFQGAGVSLGEGVVEPIAPTLQMRVTPSLTMKTIGGQRKLGDGAQAAPPKVDFRSNISARLSRLLHVGSHPLVDDEDVNQWVLGLNAGADANILPSAPWGADIGGYVGRLVEPNNDPGALDEAFDRTRFGGHLDLRWKPGGGVLSWSLGYQANMTIFDKRDYGLDTITHGPRTQGRWKFLPRTSLLYEGSLLFVRHPQEDTRQVDSNPIETQLGINGLLTTRLSMLLMAGWKATFYDNGDDFDGPVGRAEVTWHIKGTDDEEQRGAGNVGASTFLLGYSRNVSDSGIANYYQSDQVYADLTYGVGGVLLLSLRGGVAFVHHPAPLDSQGGVLTVDGGEIDEIRPSARLYAEYRFSNTFALFNRTAFSASPNDNLIQIIQATGADDRNDNLRYYRFTSFLGVRWFM